MLKFSQTFLTIILSVLFGLFAGFLGIIIFSSSSLPLFGWLNLSNRPNNNQIVIEQPRNVLIEQDTQIKQVENDLLPAMVNIYKEKKNTDIVSRAYDSSEIESHAFVLTADGWLVAPAGVLDNVSKNQYVAVGYQNKQYKITKVLEDKAAGISFIKMDANNLSVARLGSSESLTLGQTVVSVIGRDKLAVFNISKIGYHFNDNKSLILNSDFFKKRIFLSKSPEDNDNGGVMANFKGEVVGIISGDSVIPVDFFSNIVSGVLDKQKIIRGTIGISYIDLAQVDGLISVADKGAYVVEEPIKGSPSYGFVKKGDLIKKVDDKELNSLRGLAEIINKYKMGDRVELLLSRGGKDLNIDVILK